MEIGPLVSRTVLTVSPHGSLAETARQMNERGVGSAVVLSEGGPGIITERDILRAVGEGADLGSLRVEDYMTFNAITASPQWRVTDAAREMSRGGFRHLIVLDGDGNVAGVLSIRDLVPALLELLP